MRPGSPPTKIRLLPVNGWVWVTRAEGAKEVSGLVIPERYRGVGELAVVRYSDNPDFPPNTTLALGKNSGERITIGTEELWAVRADEVVAVVYREPIGAKLQAVDAI